MGHCTAVRVVCREKSQGESFVRVRVCVVSYSLILFFFRTVSFCSFFVLFHFRFWSIRYPRDVMDACFPRAL